MTFKQIINKYNTKWDIPYIKYIQFKKSLREDLTVDELYTLLSELYNIDKEVFNDINPEQLELITSKLHDIVQTESPLVNRFKLDGVEYGIIPDFSKIKAGELIDLDNLFANDDIVGLMSILYRPIKKSQWNPFNILGQKRYEIKKYKEPNHKAFENVPLAIVDGALSFFLSSYQILN